MLRTLTALVLGLAAATAAEAVCGGRDLVAAMPPEARAAFEARLARVPHAEGLVWRARRGPAVVHLVGTYHLDDPRHEALLARVRPLIEASASLLVEATPQDEAALMAALGERPELLFITEGPTLPELLSEADWAALRAALAARGYPATLGARTQPWFLATQLALPPCLAQAARQGARGLDHRIIEAATAAGIPVKGLEPPDTFIRLFETLPEGGDLALVRAALAMEGEAADLATTMVEAYFAERPWAVWELSKDRAAAMQGAAAADMAVQLRLTEDVIMVARNRAWLPSLVAAAARGPVLVAVGALHLPGEAGLLALLEAEGFSLERLR
jgi:uncharacterized protein YbaP (TraB family)